MMRRSCALNRALLERQLMLRSSAVI